jgi:regulatory protein
VRITRIERQKRRPERRSIYADGKFLAGVSEETLVRLALRPGDEIGPDQVLALQKTEELIGARNAALRLLAVRPRTIREVRDRLREKEFPDAEIQNVLAELQSSGLLNDAEFARMYVRHTFTLRPVGTAMLRRKMLLLGIDRQTIDEAIAETVDAGAWADQAERAARQYLARRRETNTPQLRKRLTDFLNRRGFDWDTIRTVTSRLMPAPDNE